MRLMDIIEFWHQKCRNKYVDEKEFAHLYVRRGLMAVRFKDGTSRIVECLQIAKVEAKRPRTGAFGRLLNRVNQELGVPVFVENVAEPEVAAGLAQKYGFTYVNDYGFDFCFCLFKDAPL
jgi:hypothetical protein